MTTPDSEALRRALHGLYKYACRTSARAVCRPHWNRPGKRWTFQI